MTIVNTLKDYILGLQHIGHIVDDLEASIDAFRKLYGLEDAAIRRVPEEPDGTEATLFAFVTIGDTEFEIIQPQSHEARADLMLSLCGGGGINHIAWRVSDIDAAVRVLGEQRVRPGHVTPDGVVDTGRSKMVYLNPADTDGLLVELVEISSD